MQVEQSTIQLPWERGQASSLIYPCTLAGILPDIALLSNYLIKAADFSKLIFHFYVNSSIFIPRDTGKSGAIRFMDTSFKHLSSLQLLKYCLVLSVFFGLLPMETRADKYIWNEYSSITQVFNADSSDLDSVRITHPEYFLVGDTVVFIQMKGMEVWLPPSSGAGKLRNDNVYNTGLYVLMLVSDIIAGDIIQFSDPLPYLEPPIPGEVNQLVKVRGARSLHIPAGDTLTCKPWNSADSTGGVVAILGSESIRVDGTIDVSCMGFAGGDTIPNEYSGVCVNENNLYLYEGGEDSAGYKGEGVIYNGFPFLRGDGFVGNAGGGGTGKYSGGGGGGNLGLGGLGGKQAEECGSYFNFNQGGYIQSYFYTNTGTVKNRIFMGGGGGAGTMNRSANKIGTKGGNGAGIIILITDTLISSGATLRAAGQSVVDTATAGAGGGGGGGVVVLAVDRYVGNLDVDVSGGNGGWTNDPVNRTGPGGFGGGGVIWHSSDNIPTSVNEITNNGAQGEWKDGTGGGEFYGTQASSSFPGGVLDSLIIPIRGFTFNILFGTQDICEGEAPDTVHASFPKGDIEFNYTWLQWKELSGWTLADGVNNEKDYVPGVMTDTTYYRRVVEAVNNGTVDTSEVYKINVLDALYNNSIRSSDTICYGLTPSVLEHDAGIVGGGDLVNFDYIWESSPVADPEDPAWTSLGVNAPNYGPDPLTDTTYFRRILYSHVCYDTSNVLTQTVLAPISGNLASGNDAVICHDEDPGTLIAGAVSGGEPGMYAYLWELSNDGSSWTGVGSSASYAPGNLSDTDPFYYYRRTVYSGGDDSTCTHISDTVTIQVHPRIEFNWLKPAEDTVCEDILPGTITPNGTIVGGDGNFSYTWEYSIDESAWNPTGINDTLEAYLVPPLSQTSWFRRLVTTGACADTSAHTKYLVHLKINNNLVTDNDTICSGEKPVPLIHDAPAISGALGPGTYAYTWLARTDLGAWAAAGGTDTQIDYAPGSLTDTTWYLRIIESGKCSDTSNQLQIIVQDDISNNIIEGGSATGDLCAGLQKDIIGAQTAGGDNTDYNYLWQASVSGSGSWADAPLTNGGMDYLTEMLTDTTDFRRLASSGVCRDTSSIVTVRVNPRPQGSISGDPDLSECYFGTTPASLYVPVSITVGEPPFTIYYHDGQSPGSVTGFASGTFTLDLTSDDSTKYTITLDSLLDNKGCWSYHSDSLPGMANALIFRYPVPVSSSDTITVCADNVALPVTGGVGEGSWGPANALYSFTSINDPASVFTTSFTNDTLYYTLVWSEQNGICPVNDTSAIVVVELYEPPSAANAGNDSTIYFASSTPLWADPASAGLGTWSVSGTAVIDPAGIHMADAMVELGESDLDQVVDNTFTWTIENGICATTQSPVFVSRQDIKQYSGFSPNDDDINDYFQFPGLDFADEFTIKILSRQGMVVRTFSMPGGVEFSEDNVAWDGLLDNGQEAPDGTYFYILVVKHAGQTYEYKGFVELVRSMVN
jgi:gliding motility-associated-like protein